MARKARPLPKLCERCESFFPSIASETCPQCFAPLTPLTEEEAKRAAEYQISQLSDPEFLEQKFEENEQFKEQSFGACLGVIVITIVVVIVSAFLIITAAHRNQVRPIAAEPAAVQIAASSYQQNGVLPLHLGNLTREQTGQIPEPGYVAPILHAKYGDSILIYAISTSNLTQQELEYFRLAVSAVGNQTTPPLVSQEVHGIRAYYAIIGANGGLVGDVAQRLVDLKI